MLSRIARGMCNMGRQIERAQNVIRILEVNHKIHLERESLDAGNTWLAIGEAFGLELDTMDEPSLYGALVLSDDNPYSVRCCIGQAREHARTARDHVSEEMWEHLNGYYLQLHSLDFDRVRRMGRSDFNRQVETFCDAFHGLADNTMIHGAGWHFLRIGKFLERACMICRILEIKRKSLAFSPEEEGRPLDVLQWQALLRSVSGFEPYRRVYDARIEPTRVLDFVLLNDLFPRSLRHALGRLSDSICRVACGNPVQTELLGDVTLLLDELCELDAEQILLGGGIEVSVQRLARGCAGLGEQIEAAFFEFTFSPPPLADRTPDLESVPAAIPVTGPLVSRTTVQVVAH